MDRTPKPGEMYRHFKNKVYQIITVATHSETGEQLVVYQAMYGDFHVYARPLSMFVSEVDHEKYPQAVQRYRFEKIDRKAVPDAGAAGIQPEAGGGVRYGRAASAQRIQPEQAGSSRPEKEDSAHCMRSEKTPDCIQPEQAGTGQPGMETPPREAAQRPRVQSPAASRRAFRQDMQEDAGAESSYVQKRRRQIAEREQRRELFRKREKRESASDALHANPNLMKFLDADTYEEKYQVLNEIQDEMTDRLVDDMAVVLDVVIPEGPLTDRFYQLKNILLTRQKYEKKRLR